jgi:hypothetical protein
MPVGLHDKKMTRQTHSMKLFGDPCLEANSRFRARFSKLLQ